MTCALIRLQKLSEKIVLKRVVTSSSVTQFDEVLATFFNFIVKFKKICRQRGREDKGVVSAITVITRFGFNQYR